MLVMEVKDFNFIIENTKNFQWYFKWVNEKKLYNFTKVNWIYKDDDLKNGLDVNQIKILNQMLYATTEDFNSIRYVTHITYDCSHGIWNRIVSVPFLNPNGDIR